MSVAGPFSDRAQFRKERGADIRSPAKLHFAQTMAVGSIQAATRDICGKNPGLIGRMRKPAPVCELVAALRRRSLARELAAPGATWLQQYSAVQQWHAVSPGARVAGAFRPTRPATDGGLIEV